MVDSSIGKRDCDQVWNGLAPRERSIGTLKQLLESSVPDFFSLHKFDKAFILPSHINALVFPLSALHDIYLPDGLRYRR
jgi:hypothetical protein